MSAVSAQNGIPLQSSETMGTYRLQRDAPMPYQSIFLKKSLTNLPQSQKFAMSSYFYSTKNSLVLRVDLLLKKKIALIRHTE